MPNVNFPFTSLGAQVINGYPAGDTSCMGAFQITGQISPSNYPGSVYLRKTLTGADQYKDQGATLVKSYGSQGDTSDPDLEALTGGNIYELDSPGSVLLGSTFPIGNSARFRANFDAYAVLGLNTSTVKVSTQDMLFFVRVSCIKNSSISITLDNTYSGDNQIGLGSTNLSDNLK